MAGSLALIYRKVLRGFGSVKNWFLPDEVRYQKLWLGISRGTYLPLNPRHSMRIMLGLYELELVRYFKAFLRPGNCIYDIGARYGYYTLAFSRMAAPGLVYAFEPDQHSCGILKEVIAHNHPSGRIEVFDLFIGRTVAEEQKLESLDDLVFVKGIKAPDTIKIDVDGPEYEILCGAGRVLKECRPKLVVEVHSPQLEIDCKGLLERSGYLVKIVKNNPLLQELRPIELNRWLVATPQ
jgi:hypothetical protein